MNGWEEAGKADDTRERIKGPWINEGETGQPPTWGVLDDSARVRRLREQVRRLDQEVKVVRAELAGLSELFRDHAHAESRVLVSLWNARLTADANPVPPPPIKDDQYF